MKPLMETVTVTRPVDGRIADLVNFYKYIMQLRDEHYGLSDDELIKYARSFWDRQHGED